MESIATLQQAVGHIFKDALLLQTALRHRSCKEGADNERLEFLGDAVLDLIVGEYLYHKLPEAAEGDLSKLRAALVNERSFARLAQALDLGRHIHLSAAEEHNRGRSKPSILSNAFEALIGAIYLDGGLEPARDAALQVLKRCFPEIRPDDLITDHKTRLQEETQARFGVIPEYRVVAAIGPDHLKEFEVALFIDDKQRATGKGGSKKSAQQAAAKAALQALLKESE
jgi:ribonuclease-3